MQVLPELNSGGVERGTVDMVQAITDAGGNALVVSAGGRLVDNIRQAGGVHITLPVNSKSPHRIYRNSRELATIIGQRNVHIVHARSRAPAWSAWYATRETNTPFVTTFHGTYGMKGVGKKKYNAVMVKGQRIIAVSHYIANYIANHYDTPQHKVRVIHRGVDLDIFHPEHVVGQRISELVQEWHLQDVQHPIIFVPGRFTRWKGQHVVLQALARLPHRQFLCLLAGDSDKHGKYYGELQQLVNELELGSHVRFVPATQHMAEAYALSQCVLCPSIRPEAFGRIPVEAQAMAKPVIAANHGGSRETVLHEETGWLVNPNDVNALTNTLKHVLELPQEQRARIGQQGMQHVAQHFSLSTMQNQTLDVYEELMRG